MWIGFTGEWERGLSNAMAIDLRERCFLIDGRWQMADDKGAAAAARIVLVCPAKAARWGKKVPEGEGLEPKRRGRNTGVSLHPILISSPRRSSKTRILPWSSCPMR
jgi:hypothetical protein